MPKGLPYFRWYPADATADESYAAMTFEQRGFYHSCLNSSWLNDGLPADLEELAALMKVTRSWLDRVWARVGRCWYEENGRLFNRRQEEERAHAIAKGEKNRRPGNQNASKSKRDEDANGTRTRLNENANGTQHARARADSDSVYESKNASSENQNSEKPRAGKVFQERWKRDEQFSNFMADYLATGAALIDEDFAEAYEFCWRTLDFEQKLARVSGLHQHAEEYHAAPRFVPKPLKFLETEWKRPVRPATETQNQPADRYRRVDRDDRGLNG